MEDTSYVSLSLEKYNELYDKAKKYDEMQAEEVTNSLIDLLKGRTIKVNLANNKETAATEEVIDNSYYDVELLYDFDGIPKGAKGKCLEPNNHIPYVDWDKHYDYCFERKVNDVVYNNVCAVNVIYLKKLNEKKEEN